jgi:hypothetical protein
MSLSTGPRGQAETPSGSITSQRMKVRRRPLRWPPAGLDEDEMFFLIPV